MIPLPIRGLPSFVSSFLCPLLPYARRVRAAIRCPSQPFKLKTALQAVCRSGAEIEANNVKFKELADEQGLKTGQNVAAGVAGVLIWPLWFAMDFKGAASKEVTALQARQQYLTTLATERCAGPGIGPPQRPRAYAPER